MTSNDWSWLLAIIGTLASIAGVVFSWMAWVQAGEAKDAAREAAEAVRTRNLAHNFAGWAVDARELLTAVRSLHFENARRSATELLGDLSHTKGLGKGLRQNTRDIDEIVRILDVVNNYLSDELVFVETRERLVQDCQTIYRKLHEMAGAVEAQVEGV